MIRKYMIAGFLFVFLTGIPLYSQDQIPNSQDEKPKDYTNEILSFEKRFKIIDDSVKYLKDNNIDSNDIISAYTEAEGLFRDIKTSAELKDYDMAVKLLSRELAVLEEKSSDRASLAKRMNLMYIIMVSMGIFIILLMSAYSIYMYSRRK